MGAYLVFVCAGEAVGDARGAEELTGFFRNPARRALLKKALAKLDQLEAKVLERAERKLESGELERAVEEALTTPGTSSGNLPESSASIPVP